METLKPKAKTKNALRRGARHLIDRARGGAYAELADTVTGSQNSIANAALQDTVEFEPVFPLGLELRDPPEHGFHRGGLPPRPDNRPRAA